MTQVYLKVRENFEHYIVAMCDKALLGQTLSHGEVKFKVSEDFYGGDLVDLKTCIEHLSRATIANMVGKRSVDAAIRAGFVNEQAVLYIEGHPHAQWVKL